MPSSQIPTRILPARPSLDSIRKQAKKLVRDVATGDADTIARVRLHLPRWAPPLLLRDAQLVLACEFGFAGWKDLREEVLKRTGHGLEWAAAEAKRAIHDNDVNRLKALLAEHPGLLTWRGEKDRPLLQATTPYAMDVTDPEREAQFCRLECAAVLVDAGADIAPSVWEGLIRAGAGGMLKLLREKKALPDALAVLAALADADGVRRRLDDAEGHDIEAVNFAFMGACRFKREATASMLLERCIALDPDLGAKIDRWRGRDVFVNEMIANGPPMYGSMAPWIAFVVRELRLAMINNDLPAFVGWLEREAWLLDEAHVALQVELLEHIAIYNREAFLQPLLDHDPAVLHTSPPPPSGALSQAFNCRNAHLVPLLMRIWPLPDDLPHAAGIGDLDRVKRWFDDKGQPALGELSRHHPANSPAVSEDLHWGPITTQHVLDVALAWAVLNRRYEVAEFLLAHGANINTNWNTHEPASILHDCAINGDFDGARFLIAHGIDLAIRDHRWNATAAGWAHYAAKDEAMTKLLREAEETWNSG